MEAEPRPDPAPERRGHVVLCGLLELGYRTLEELHRLGERVVVVASSAEARFRDGAQALGAEIIEGNYRDERVLRDAGLANAQAIVITEDDDVGNLHAALAAEELNPGIRIALRMFNIELGERIRSLFGNCLVLDPSAIVAPAFVAAALHDTPEQPILVGDRALAVTTSTDADVLLPLARTPE